MPGDDDDLFREAVKGAVPLDPKRKQRVAVKKPVRARKPASAPGKRTTFQVEIEGERVLGRAPGVSRKQCRDLRAGEVAVEGSVDLHHMTAEVARDVLRGRIEAAARDGKRCLLVIHGRGKHSGGAPVLRDVTIQCLTSPPCAALVRAFCTAQPKDGGPGSMYVRLTSGT